MASSSRVCLWSAVLCFRDITTIKNGDLLLGAENSGKGEPSPLMTSQVIVIKGDGTDPHHNICEVL